ncbi:NACHT domain-containing protein [Xanthobacter sediminis]
MDRFSSKTVLNLLIRAGGRCCFPACPEVTTGPDLTGDGILNLGEAAHICAASPDGARYDERQTPEERRSQANGIWLCRKHHAIIDRIPESYPVEKLKLWKEDAESRQYRRLLTSPEAMDQALYAQLKDIGSGPGAELAQSIADLRMRAQRDLESFRARSWPTHPVKLRLTMDGKDGSWLETDFERVAGTLCTFKELHLTSPGGMGKTTTLLQVAQALIDGRGPIPLFLPLSEWSTTTGSFFASIRCRPAFQSVEEHQFTQLAASGDLLLMLDGWNEIPEDRRRAAVTLIEAMRRDYPDVAIVISTRRQATLPPLRKYEINIEPLNDVQQKDIASKRGNGATLLEWIAGVDLTGLLTIPIYFDAFLSRDLKDAVPRSKGEIIGGFLHQYESDAARSIALYSLFADTQTAFLTSLATEMTSRSTTAIADDLARYTAHRVHEQLASRGQIGKIREPAALLDALADRHVLVRGPDKAITFQHQIFQEWYASYEVERRLPELFSVDRGPREKFISEILDQPSWEEALLFCCDRLSRSGEPHRKLTGSIVLLTLGVDPILAGWMIKRSDRAIWSDLRTKIIPWLRNWYSNAYGASSTWAFFSRVPRPFRLMLLLNDDEFREEISSDLRHVDRSYCAKLLRETARDDLQPPPSAHRYLGFPIVFSDGAPRTVPITPHARLLPGGEPETDRQENKASHNYRSAIRMGENAFWREPALDEGDPPDAWAWSDAVSDQCKPEISRIAAYFAGPLAVGFLIRRIFQLQRRIDRSWREETVRQRQEALSRVLGNVTSSHVASLIAGVLGWRGTGSLAETVTLASLVANHGVHRQGFRSWAALRAPLPVPSCFYAALVERVGSWIERCCVEPKLTTGEILVLAEVVARVPDVALAAPLNRMLTTFLRLRRAASDTDKTSGWNMVVREAYDAHAFNSAFMRAFSNMKTPYVIGLVQERTQSPDFALEATCVLLRMGDPAFEFIPDLWSMRSRPDEKPELPDFIADPELDTAVGSLNDTVARYIEQGLSTLALRMGQAALSVPGCLDDDTVTKLLRISEFPFERLLLLKRLALAGKTLSADDIVETAAALAGVLAGHHSFARTDPIMEIACLYLFSDDPARIVTQMTPASPHLKLFWHLVARAPTTAAELALVSLVSADIDFAKNKVWLTQMVDLGTETSAQFLVGMCNDERYASVLQEWQLQTPPFAKLFELHPHCRLDLRNSDLWMKQGPAADDLLPIVASSNDEDALFRVVDGYVAAGRSFDFDLAKIIREFVSPIFGQPLTSASQARARVESARTRLFEASNESSVRAVLARRCLTDLDDHLDMCPGRFGATRHPDISSGRPWPVPSITCHVRPPLSAG